MSAPISLPRSRYVAATRAPWGTTQSRVSTHKFGRNPDIDTATVPEDVWDDGGAYPWPTAAAVLTIVSTSANDTLLGSGAQTIKVIGLDGDWNYTEETVEMDGLSGVDTVTEFLRVYRMGSVKAGATGFNEGDITASHGATVLARMTATEASTLMAVFTVPASDKEKGFDTLAGEILGWSVRIEGPPGSTRITVQLQVREFEEGADINSGAWRTVDREEAGVEGRAGHEFVIPVPIPARSDIRVRVIGATANNIAVQADFDIFCYRPI